jgi:hypothetical protein
MWMSNPPLLARWSDSEMRLEIVESPASLYQVMGASQREGPGNLIRVFFIPFVEPNSESSALGTFGVGG